MDLDSTVAPTRAECGTRRGWDAHYHAREEQCRTCQAWAAAAQEQLRVMRPESAILGVARWRLDEMTAGQRRAAML
jgi:hypothetical protein